MIIYMFDLICITNRTLCSGDFIDCITDIAKQRPKAIILREKDLSEDAYKSLARQVMEICRCYDTSCILHSHIDSAIELGANAIHLPMHILAQMTIEQKSRFKEIGASCHSVEEATLAEKLGCSYIIAGHIYETDCKKGVPPRGITFLEKICKAVNIPVYAIGGIDESKIIELKHSGAKGACIMSGLMNCENKEHYFQKFMKEKDRYAKNEV